MLRKTLSTSPAGTPGLKHSLEGPRRLTARAEQRGRTPGGHPQPQAAPHRSGCAAPDRLRGTAAAPPITAARAQVLPPGRSGSLRPAPAAARCAGGPSGPASAYLGPPALPVALAARSPATTSRLLARDSTSGTSSTSSGSSGSSSSSGGGHGEARGYGGGQVRGTVLRTIDPVLAAASAARALSRPCRTGTSTAAATSAAVPGGLSNPAGAPGTFSSVDTMDDAGSGGAGAAGVRLLIVVGVVLLDDPYWTDGAASGPPSTGGGGDAGGARPVRVLLAQRPVGKSNAGLWEFPGGKVDPGETPEAALVRELREELGIAVDPVDLQPLTFASHTYPTFHLLMPLYACRRWQGEPRGAEGQAVAWATAEEVPSYTLTPADVPLVPAVLAAMRHGVTPQC